MEKEKEGKKSFVGFSPCFSTFSQEKPENNVEKRSLKNSRWFSRFFPKTYSLEKQARNGEISGFSPQSAPLLLLLLILIK